MDSWCVDPSHSTDSGKCGSAMLGDEFNELPVGFQALIAAISALLPSRFSTRLKL